MNEIPIKKNGSKVRIYIDIIFFTLMILVLIPQTTGIPVHEWASFIILIPFFLHLIINWNWIATNSVKLLKKESNKTRFDYFLNWLLYLFMIIVTVSGIVISEAALPIFGIHFAPDRFWSSIHNTSATLFMAVFGIHIALHWKWILGTIRKLKIVSEIHYLAEIKSIVIKYYSQLLLIVFISTALSFVIWFFNYTDWADSFRLNTGGRSSDKSENMTSSWIIYTLPLLKVGIIMTIPALITTGVIRIKKLL